MREVAGMRIPLNPCYILHLRPYRETSLIADVMSRDHGRITLVAKGARRHSCRSAGLYQPMRPLQIAWTMRGDMGTLTGIEATAAAQTLSGQWLIAAFYLNELLIRLLHQHESHPELYAAYERALHDLSEMRPEEPTLRVFEKHLLLSLGYGLVLDQDFQTGLPIEPETTYFYALDRGPCRENAKRTDDIRISGASLLALQSESLTDTAQILECKHLMRAMLDAQLGTRPLGSRKLYRQLVANRSSN